MNCPSCGFPLAGGTCPNCPAGMTHSAQGPAGSDHSPHQDAHALIKFHERLTNFEGELNTAVHNLQTTADAVNKLHERLELVEQFLQTITRVQQ